MSWFHYPYIIFQSMTVICAFERRSKERSDEVRSDDVGALALGF